MSFLAAWPRDGQAAQADRSGSVAGARTRRIDLAGLAATLAELSVSLDAARSEGVTIDPWGLAGVGRKEVQNAAVLAGLWRQASGGTLALQFLDAFLRRAELRGALSLPSRAQLEQGYHVEVENCPLGAASERIDITVECADFMIGIEVKISAPPGTRQLERYRDAIGARARVARQKPVLLFLAPYPTREPDVIHVGWNDVAAAARSLPLEEDRSFNRELIERFAAHVSTFEKQKR